MALDPTQWINMPMPESLPSGTVVTSDYWNQQWSAIVLLSNHAEDAIQNIRDTIATETMMNDAIQAAADAAESEIVAGDSATAAALSAAAAATSETNAEASETAAAASVVSATAAEDAAEQSATDAGASEDAAAISEANALGYKNEAQTSAITAGNAKDLALSAEAAANSFAVSASASQTAAGESATAAAASAAAALTSEENAADSAEDAAESAATLAAQIAAGGLISASEKGAANGVAELDASGKVPIAQLITFIEEYSTFPAVGEAGKIYTSTYWNSLYRWNGSAFVPVSVTLGESAATAYRGDRGKTAYDHSQSAHAPADAEQNVQSDWTQTIDTADDYIKNKPTEFPPESHTHDSIWAVLPYDIKGGNGIKDLLTAGAAFSSFGMLAYINSSGKAVPADKDAATTMPVVAIYIEDAALDADADGVFLYYGRVRNTSWSLTPGTILYAGDSGGIATTAPTGSGDQVQRIGVVLTATCILFNPDLTVVEV